MKRELPGAFEQLVLAALLHLGEEAYGMSVRQEINRRTGRDIAIGAVYATLDRLEAKGYCASLWAEGTPERGGKPRRNYRVTGPGEQALREAVDQLQNMVSGLELGWTS